MGKICFACNYIDFLCCLHCHCHLHILFQITRLIKSCSSFLNLLMHTTLLIGTPNALTIIENIVGIPVALDLQQSWIRISPIPGTIWSLDILMYQFTFFESTFHKKGTTCHYIQGCLHIASEFPRIEKNFDKYFLEPS